MVCSLVSVRTSRSSTAVGLAELLGRATSIPRCISGAVSMKMRSRTRITSTSGMILISARLVPIREFPPPPEDSSLNAIFGRDRRLGHGTRQEVEEIEGEAFHLRRPVLHAVDEVVVAHDRGNGGAEAGGGGDQGLGDAGGDDGEARRALLPDAVEGAHDAPYGAEEADERRRAGGGGEEGKIALHSRHLDGGGAPHRAIHRLEPARRKSVLRLGERVLEQLAAGHPAGRLLAARDVELGERALAVPARAHVDGGEPTPLAEHLEEAHGLPVYLPELPPLLHDERPADHREDGEHEENELRDGAGVEDQLDDACVQIAIAWHQGLLLKMGLRAGNV